MGAVLGVFRQAAHEEDSLAGIVSCIETSLGRQVSDEQLVTAILAEVSAGAERPEHPASELQLAASGPGRSRRAHPSRRRGH